jgi:hypothetical protein
VRTENYSAAEPAEPEPSADPAFNLVTNARTLLRKASRF